MSAEKNAESVNLFRKPAALLDTEPGPAQDQLDGPLLPDGRRPRGLGERGLVRTTGWLRLGTHPVASGWIAAGACLLPAIVVAVTLLPVAPVTSGLCVLLSPLAGYGFWYWVTMRLAPASAAHNVGTVAAGQLEPGTWVRLYGVAGPVGQVTGVRPENEPKSSTTDGSTPVRIAFAGGAKMTWPHDHPLHTAELCS